MKYGIFKNKSLSVIFIGFIVFGIIILKLAVFDNPVKLCTFAEWFDEPSTPYYLVLNRIYKLSDKEEFSETLIKYIRNDKNPYLHKRYARVLGVIGKNDALPALKNACSKYCWNENYKITADYIVISMGIIGDEKIVSFLEKLLNAAIHGYY